jgi:hypothetical protein
MTGADAHAFHELKGRAELFKVSAGRVEAL